MAKKITEITEADKQRMNELREFWINLALTTREVKTDEAETAIGELYKLISLPMPKVEWYPSPLAALKATREFAVEENKRLGTNDDPSKAYFGGLFWAGFGCWCDYWRVNDWCPHQATTWVNLLKSGINYWWALKGNVFASQPPECIHYIKQNNRYLSHRDGGPSWKYRDGWCDWRLNGVKVPQWLAETPEGQIDPARMKEIENAEVRREFIRKVGIARIYKALSGKVIHRSVPVIEDREVPYELVEMKIGDEKLRYLKMENPTLEGILHVERVPTNCNTVEAAINFRNQFKEEDIDNEKGAEWYQQGDILFIPDGKKKVRQWPTWISSVLAPTVFSILGS